MAKRGTGQPKLSKSKGSGRGSQPKLRSVGAHARRVVASQPRVGRKR